MTTARSRPAPAARTTDRPWPRIPEWTRQDWLALADRLLAAAQRWGGSPRHAGIRLPGPVGGYGERVDALEGFARTFLVAGFRLAGERGHDPTHLVDWYARGLAAGADPHSPERWVRLEEHPQAKVEAASIALVLDLTRPWIWDQLGSSTQEQLVDYLSSAVGDQTYPRINWVWFRLVVQTFLRSVGGPHSAADMAEDLATHDTFTRPDGWLADGSTRAYDHYAGWALHLYPTLWARMAGAGDLAAPRRERDRAALDRFLQDALDLVGADGAPLLQGRSLTYRFAAAAPFWVGAVAEVGAVPGQLRRAATGVVSHFTGHGVPDERGLLTLGWHHRWPALAQAYSGPGSPYWAAKGLLGLSLPADHPVWTDAGVPLPIERGDVLRAVRAPGWIVSGTRRDGLLTVTNHGTDHAEEGRGGADSPLYARLGYSTATSPLLDDGAWTDPLDQSVVLLDGAGRATHRAGMTCLDVRVDTGGCGGSGVDVGYAASTALVHWVTPDAEQAHHGSGYTGTVSPAGRVTVCSVVRGGDEVRLVAVHDLEPAVVAVRLGGWAVAHEGDARTTWDDDGVQVSVGTLQTRLHALVGAGTATVRTAGDASPLATRVQVPCLQWPPVPGQWTATWLWLGRPRRGDRRCTAALDREGDQTWATIRWPDGAHSRVRLPALSPERAAPAARKAPRPTVAGTSKESR